MAKQRNKGDEIKVAAAGYVRRGWAPIPVPFRSKRPDRAGWQNLRIKDAELGGFFNGKPQNIGVLTGEPSGWLVDVDLDHPDAVADAENYLPATNATFGRASKPRSHWLFKATGPVETHQRRFPDGKMIVELRATGGQTIFPPSVHESGEPIEWFSDGQPTEIDPAELRRCVDDLADAVLRQNGIEPAVKTSGSAAPNRTKSGDGMDVIERAARYLEKIPPAVSGQRGHDRTFHAACILVLGFGLSPDNAYPILQRWNETCKPPWSEEDLRHKLDDANKREGERGWMLNGRGYKGPDKGLTIFLDKQAEAIEDEGPEPPPDPGALPEYLLQVPGFVGEVLKFNLATAKRRQPTLALAGALALQASLVGRKVKDEFGTRPNLQIVSVGKSGTGKDHARQINDQILSESGGEDLLCPEEVASDAGLYRMLHEHPSRLWQLDEFGRFLRTTTSARQSPHLYNVPSALMRLYSSAGKLFKPKAYGDSKQNLEIDQPHLVLHATTTPDALYGALNADAIAEGFLGRISLFEGDEKPPRQMMPLPPIPSCLVEAARRWTRYNTTDSQTGHLNLLTIPSTPDALAIFDQLAGYVDEQQACAAVGSALWARAEEKAKQMAIVYATSAAPDNPIIGPEAAKWACDLARHITARMVYLASIWIASNAQESKQQRVYRIIEAQEGPMGRRELCRRTQWLTKREREEIIMGMQDAGLIREVREATGTKPKTFLEIVKKSAPVRQ